MVTSFVLVRHGQSTWNAESRWQGQADPPLSDLGRSQARAAGPALKDRFGRFDAAVSSPQRRAAETADILTAAQGGTAVGSVKRIADLRERSAGPWSGLIRSEIDATYPGFLESGERPEGFEGDEPLFARVMGALRTAAVEDDTPIRQVLAVCHGGVINVLVDVLAPERRGRVPNLSGWTASMHNGELAMNERFDLLGAAQQTGGDSRIV